MATETEIANMALQLVGTRSNIASLAEESPEAEAVNLLFEPMRDMLFEEANWNFTTRVAILELLRSLPGTPEAAASTATEWTSTFPIPAWNYTYGYPDDTIKIRFVIPQGAWQQLYRTQTLGLQPPWQSVAVPFEVANQTSLTTPFPHERVILTNAPDALAILTYKETNTELWTQKFVQALVALLAYRLAVPLSGDKDIARGNFALYQSYVAEAGAADANEGLTVINNPVDWIDARESPGLFAPYPWLLPPT